MHTADSPPNTACPVALRSVGTGTRGLKVAFRTIQLSDVTDQQPHILDPMYAVCEVVVYLSHKHTYVCLVQIQNRTER